MIDWLATLAQRLADEASLVRVTVAAVRGSTPREPGACMLVGQDRVDGTIGGGHLEWKSLAAARNLLDAPAAARVDRFVLGATLGQCCGGVVEVWCERVTAADGEFFAAALAARDAGQANAIATTWRPAAALEWKGAALERQLRQLPADAPRALLARDGGDTLVQRIDTALTPLWLYGAGHVGRAVVRTLADLPFAITWIDGRDDAFPAGLPAHVTRVTSDDPAAEAASAPEDALHLVMTHRHDVDFAICRALLERNEFRWAGVIGSETKAASFRGRLARAGIAPGRIARLVSPIGVPGIASKAPAAIAVAVAAQLLQLEAAEGAASHDTTLREPR